MLRTAEDGDLFFSTQVAQILMIYAVFSHFFPAAEITKGNP
jgi:hypothetical protein